MVIRKHKVTNLLFPVRQEVIQLLANNKSHNYSYKMNIKIQSMYQKVYRQLEHKHVIVFC